MTTRLRFALWCTIASALAVLLAGLVALVALDSATTQVIDARLQSTTTRLVDADAPGAACELVVQAAADGERTLAVLVDGRERCRSRASGISPRALGVRGEGDAGTRQRRVGGGTWRTDVRVAGPATGPRYVVVVAERVDASLRARADARVGIFAAMGIGLVLATVIGAIAAGPATRGIDRLVQRIRSAAAHVADPDAGVGRVGSRDLDQAAAAVDQLLDDLRASDAARRRLFADAAHELRTPVTSIRTNAQLLARDANLEEEARDIAERIARQSAVVGSLVAGLVDHAGAVGWGASVQEGVELRVLVQDAVRRFAERHPDARVELELDDSRASVDPELVRRAVGNLLDNAAQHGAGLVSVQLAHGVIAVADDGPGFAESLGEDAFRPFARGAATGSGLGLAFVDHVARAHGGEARIASRAPARVELELPAASGSRETQGIPSDDAKDADRPPEHAHESEEVDDAAR